LAYKRELLHDNLTLLKIRNKSLAAEAAIVRLEHKKAKAQGCEDRCNKLNRHRKVVVRRAARRGLLAYAFLRGRPYTSIEMLGSIKSTTQHVALAKGVWKVVKRFGGAGREEEVGAWLVPPAAAATHSGCCKAHTDTIQ